MKDVNGRNVREIFRSLFGRIERRVRLPDAFEARPIVVSGEARLKYTLFGGRAVAREYADLLAVAEDFVRPGDTVWDVGSNVGVFAIAAASVAGSPSPVIALEPDLYLCGLLRRTLRLRENSDLNVKVLPVAVAEAVGLRDLEISSRGRTGNRLSSTDGEPDPEAAVPARETTLVPCFSIDSLMAHLPPPDFLKVDVEGGEFSVVRGADRVLSEVRPMVYCEVRPHHADALTRRFHELQYSLFEYDEASREREPIETCSFNTLAIPEERATRE